MSALAEVCAEIQECARKNLGEFPLSYHVEPKKFNRTKKELMAMLKKQGQKYHGMQDVMFIMGVPVVKQ